MNKIAYSHWKIAQNKRNITVYDNSLAISLGIHEAIFVRRFIYLWEKFKHLNEDSIFIIPLKFYGPIGMSNHAFRTIVKKWEDLGIITTESKGLPLKKWYVLKEKKLASYLSKAMADSQVVESNNLSSGNQQDKVVGSNKIYNKYVNKNKHCRQGARGGFKEYGDVSQTKADKLSIKLQKLLVRNNKLVSQSNVKSWAKELDKLLQQIPNKEIVSLLKWYDIHIKDTYVPKAYSAKTFRIKYQQIKDAMEKEQEAMLKATGKDKRIDDKKYARMLRLLG